MKILMKGGNPELLIYGAIGIEVTAKGIADLLKTIKGDLTVRINSGGGDVFEGMAIYNMLAARKPTVIIDGLAASMASVIAMAGSKIHMHAGSMLMIHKPWTTAGGNADELQKSAELLNQIEQTMMTAYTRRGIDAEALAGMLSAETWFTAEQALAAGFIDEVIDTGADYAANVNTAIYASIPDSIKDHIDTEQARANSIRDLMAMGFGGLEIDAETLIRQGMNISQARTYLLNELGKNNTPISGVVMTDSINRVKEFRAAASDALLARGGIKATNSLNDNSRGLVKHTLAGMAEACLSMHGVSTAGMSRHQVINAAMTHSTSDFPLLLSDTFGKSLAAGYAELASTHKIWTGEREVEDFRQATLVRMSETPELLQVREGAEYTYGTLSDDAEYFRVATYGRMFSITRQALINDDLEAFTRMPAAWGRSATRLECDLTYQALTGAATMRDGKVLFHADHGNLVSGTVGMTIAGLTDARLKLRLQKGTDGTTHLALEPAYLIVPAALESEAEQLLASLIDPAKDIPGVPNMQFIRRLTLVVEPRLDDVSASAYYLACAPSQCDHIARIYLAGEARPYFEQKEGWSVDGLEMKTRLDFAAAALDYRGIVKVPA